MDGSSSLVSDEYDTQGPYMNFFHLSCFWFRYWNELYGLYFTTRCLTNVGLTSFDMQN